MHILNQQNGRETVSYTHLDVYKRQVLIMPNGQDVMSIGDKVIVVTTNQGLDDISDIVKER